MGATTRLSFESVGLDFGNDAVSGRVRFTLRGSHDCEVFGIPRTGKAVVIEGEIHCSFDMTVPRVREMIVTWDGIGLMRQLMMT